MKREVADDLARSGMIRMEEAIEEDDAGHCPERVRSRVRGGKVSPKISAAFFGASQPALCPGDEPALDVSWRGPKMKRLLEAEAPPMAASGIALRAK
jgi:hypothetical protein